MGTRLIVSCTGKYIPRVWCSNTQALGTSPRYKFLSLQGYPLSKHDRGVDGRNLEESTLYAWLLTYRTSKIGSSCSPLAAVPTIAPHTGVGNIHRLPTFGRKLRPHAIITTRLISTASVSFIRRDGVIAFSPWLLPPPADVTLSPPPAKNLALGISLRRSFRPRKHRSEIPREA